MRRMREPPLSPWFAGDEKDSFHVTQSGRKEREYERGGEKRTRKKTGRGTKRSKMDDADEEEEDTFCVCYCNHQHVQLSKNLSSLGFRTSKDVL